MKSLDYKGCMRAMGSIFAGGFRRGAVRCIAALFYPQH